MKNIIKLALFMLLFGSVSVSQAQNKVWRCPGNVFTNNAAETKKFNGACKEVVQEITVTGVKKSSSRSRNQEQSARVQSSSGASTTSHSAGMRIDAGDQSQRNASARQIIERELNKTQTELGNLQKEYNNGRPTRLPHELTNDTAYEERAQSLSRQIAIKVDEINSLQKELGMMR